MKDLIFIQCVPLDKFFLWQIEVQITNFRKFEVSSKMEIVIWYPARRVMDLAPWKDLEKKYPEVNFFYYPDSGVNLGLYIPQLRPHSLKKHFFNHSKRLKDKTFFYHDSDIIFNYLPNFEELVEGDICWQSDCSSYLDYSYMRRKEEEGRMPIEEGVKLMAEIGEISIDTIKSYNGNTGGAQNILKGIDFSYWEDVERMCVNIRKKFFYNVPSSINKKYFASENAGWQSWTCDMWAVNFALWKRGIVTSTTPRLDFSWATDGVDTYNKKPIFHNAGVSAADKHLFHKGSYINTSPLNEQELVKIEQSTDKSSASYMYYLAMKEVK